MHAYSVQCLNHAHQCLPHVHVPGFFKSLLYGYMSVCVYIGVETVSGLPGQTIHILCESPGSNSDY